MITELAQTIKKSYEETFSTWSQMKIEFKNIAMKLDELDERNTDSNHQHWERNKEFLLTYKIKDLFTPLKKIVTNLQIISAQLDKIPDVSDDFINMESQIATLENEINQLRNDNNKLHGEYKYLELTYLDKIKESEDTQKLFLELISKLITFRDQLTLFKTNQDSNVNTLLDSLYEEIGVILKKFNVDILNSIGGQFNYTTQTIVKSIQTEDEAQVDKIAKSSRPGYQYNGICIRPQEVIVYSR